MQNNKNRTPNKNRFQKMKIYKRYRNKNCNKNMNKKKNIKVKL